MIFAEDKGHRCCLFCDVDPSINRGLDFLKKGYPNDVEGKINKIDMDWVYLSVVYSDVCNLF